MGNQLKSENKKFPMKSNNVITMQNGDSAKRLNFILLKKGELDQIFSVYSNQYQLYSSWLPYVALSIPDNFMLLGYETENGYGGQLILQHGGDSTIKVRAKNSGTWGGWRSI